MPDISGIRGGPSEVASTPGSSTGVTLTANASANTKATSYTTLLAATAYRTSWLMLTIGDANAGAAYLIDIAVGAAAAEVPIINNLFYHQVQTAGQVGGSVLLIPISIEAGKRISARCQSATGGATIKLTAHVFATPIDAPLPGNVVETIGATTASSRGTTLNDPGATPHADGTWTQISAAITYPWRWMCVAMANPSDIAYAGVKSDLVDIAVGAGGAEQVLVADLWTYGNGTNDACMTQTFCFPVAVPAGARIAARHRSASGTTGDRRLDVVIYGVT